MKVWVDNIIFKLQKHGGISTYFENLYTNFPDKVYLISDYGEDISRLRAKLLLLKKYNIKNYFFLDSSFPMIYLLNKEYKNNNIA